MIKEKGQNLDISSVLTLGDFY